MLPPRLTIIRAAAAGGDMKACRGRRGGKPLRAEADVADLSEGFEMVRRWFHDPDAAAALAAHDV